MSTQTPYEKAVDVIAGGLRSSYIHWNDLHESRRQVYRRRARRLLAKADDLLREHYVGEQRKRFDKAIDGIEAAAQDHYYGGAEEWHEHVEAAITEAREQLTATPTPEPKP